MEDLIEFLDKYKVEYRVEGDRVVVDGDVRLYKRGIDKLPHNIGRLECEVLDLSCNRLKSLPDSICDLKLKKLYLYDNKLKSLSDSICDLKCEELNLSGNKLKSLPENIGKLNCKSLALGRNELVSLQDSFSDLECEALYLYINPLEPCLHLFKQWKDNVKLQLDATSMYKEGARFVGDYRKEIDLAYELRKPDNAGIKSMFDMGLF